MKSVTRIAAAVLFAAPLAAVAFEDGPVDGLVVDTKTGAPISGAVVAATWNRREDPAHGMPICRHVQTAISDGQGRYHIDRWGESRTLGSILFGTPFAVGLRVFKPSYTDTRGVIGLTSAPPPGELRMNAFAGTRAERLKYLRDEARLACTGAGLEQRALQPYLQAVVSEAETVATDSTADQNIVRLLHLQLFAVTRDPSQPVTPADLPPQASTPSTAPPPPTPGAASGVPATPPPAKKVTIPAPTPAQSSTTPPPK